MIATRTVKSALPVILAFHVLLCVNTSDVRAQTADSPDAQVDTAYDDEELTDIDLLAIEIPTVITTTRREKKITDVPYAVSVITAEDIRWSGARSVSDALRLVPGVDVAELAYGQYAVSPRAFHNLYASKTMVLVDGRAIFDTIFNGTQWGYWPFQLEDIERIEVIRGPGGVTWGANAVNGVINIITKDPADQLGLTLSGCGGSRGTYLGHVGYAFQDDKLRMRVSSELEGSAGFKEGGTIVSNLDDAFTGIRANVHGIYEAGPDDTLTFSIGSLNLRDNYPLPVLEGIGTNRATGRSEFVLGKWTHRIADDNVIELTGYVNDFYQQAGNRWMDAGYQQFALQLSHTFDPAEDHTLMWGIDTRLDLTDATNADPYMLTDDYITSGVVGVYVQDEWRFAPRWTLSLGGRVDYDAWGGFEPSGRASLAYKLSDNSLVYGAVSRAFMMPSGTRRHLDFPLMWRMLHVTADRDMDAETLLAYELGYRGLFLDDRLEFNLNGYWHDYRDLIGSGARLGPPGLMQFYNSNEASLSMYGVELETCYRVNKQLTLLGHYTFQQTDTGEAAQETFEILPPKHKFMVGARYSATDDLHLSGHLYYVDATQARNVNMPMTSRRIAPYFRLDLRVEHEFRQDKASIAVGVRNLLDPSHPEGGSATIDFAEVPRMVYAELRMRLD